MTFLRWGKPGLKVLGSDVGSFAVWLEDIEGLYRISTSQGWCWQVVPIMNTALNIQTIIEVDRRGSCRFWDFLLVHREISTSEIVWNPQAHSMAGFEGKPPCPGRCRKCTDSPVGWTDLQGYTCQDRSHCNPKPSEVCSDVGRSEKFWKITSGATRKCVSLVNAINAIILYPFLTCPYDAKRIICILPVHDLDVKSSFFSMCFWASAWLPWGFSGWQKMLISTEV